MLGTFGIFYDLNLGVQNLFDLSEPSHVTLTYSYIHEYTSTLTHNILYFIYTSARLDKILSL